jgi:hypothetical protein
LIPIDRLEESSEDREKMTAQHAEADAIRRRALGVSPKTKLPWEGFGSWNGFGACGRHCTWEGYGSWDGDRYHWAELSSEQQNDYRIWHPEETAVLDAHLKRIHGGKS